MPKILIVEDEPQLARFVQLEMEHEEYETVISGDGREGLTLAEGGDLTLYCWISCSRGLTVLKC